MVTLSPDDRSAIAVSLLRRFWLGEALSAPDLTRAGHAARFRSMERSEVLIDYGSQVHDVYCVLDGMVKLSIRTERRKERVFELVGPDQTFGEGLLFLDAPSPGRVVAIDDGRLLAVPGSLLVGLLGSSPALAIRWLRRGGLRLGRLLAELQADAGQSAGQRIVSWLLAQMSGRTDEARIHLNVSKATLAALLNTTPETFSRVLKHLREQGVVRVEGRDIVVTNPVRLRYLQPCVFCGKSITHPTEPAPPDAPLLQQADGARADCEVPHWFGLGHCDCDVPHWCAGAPIVPK
jgi:CRP-like cAMP-binding protein